MTKNWLLNSGIFISEPSDHNFGGVHSFYDEKNKEFAFLYPEITGYYSSTMRFLYEHEKDEKYLHFAKASCNWLIDLYEKTARNFYGGAVGYMDFYGNFNHAIIIRSFLSKDKNLYYQAGAGIVADSKPMNEYKETVNKAKALIKALE